MAADGSTAQRRMERLLAPLSEAGVTPSPAAAVAAPPPPPKLLTDAQMKGFIENGFVAVPITDFPPEWHMEFWRKCHDWVYEDQAEAQQDSRMVFPHIGELGDVLGSSTLRGALSSILGPDYVQHPHRTLHNYGNRNEDMSMEASGDQMWHKDGHHVPMRSHFPRWVMVFYYNGFVTEDMGPTAIIPGATYTTIDREDRSQDFLEDIMETYLDTPESAAARKENMASVTAQMDAVAAGVSLGEAETRRFTADQTRGLGEAAALADLGAKPPRDAAERSIFGHGADGRDGFGPGKWKLLSGAACPPGTAFVMDYNIFHRGTTRLPGSLWRSMFKLQFFRVSAPLPSQPSWDSAPSSAAEADPFAHVPHASEGQRQIWTAMWRWLRGEHGDTPAASLRALPASPEGRAIAEHAALMLGSRREIERIGAGYTLGNIAAAHDDDAAVAALLPLMREAPRTRRAAMYGLAAAGDIAVPGLLQLLQILQQESAVGGDGGGAAAAGGAPGTLTHLAASPDDATKPPLLLQHETVCAMMALGEATRVPCAATVTTLGSIVSTWQAALTTHVSSVLAEAEERGLAWEPTVHRSLLTSGQSTGMSVVDERATALQRGIAAGIQALGFVGERASALAAAGDEAQQQLALAVAEVLLPFTLENQPVDLLPPGAIVPSQATYWCVEGAAFALTKLVSGGVVAGPQRAAAWRQQQLHAVVKGTMPAHHSDPRYAFGICLAALERASVYAADSKSAGGPSQGFTAALRERLTRCHARWEELYRESAGEDVPEEWLGGDKGGGIEWAQLA